MLDQALANAAGQTREDSVNKLFEHLHGKLLHRVDNELITQKL